jgi:hypothetical protein
MRRGAEFFVWLTNDACVLKRRDVWQPEGTTGRAVGSMDDARMGKEGERTYGNSPA